LPYSSIHNKILFNIVEETASRVIIITTTNGENKGDVKHECGDVNTMSDVDAMEQEDMFVEAHESFEHTKKEWGGPRRGGRLPEPTRFGDWERKGRCSDF
jgi:hypothetical protein